jgi:hypothetical protein
LLAACADWPYARTPELRALSGLRRHEFAWAVERAKRAGLVEAGHLAIDGRVERLALTGQGYGTLGQMPRAAMLTACWLASGSLDVARRFVAECIQVAEIIWSLSPFTLPPEAMSAPRPTRLPMEVIKTLRVAPRRLRLDALACLRFGREHYRNLAILVDPGGIALDWFFHQFRAYHAWARCGEFVGRYRTLPVLVVIAAHDQTRGRLAGLWHDAAGRRRSEARLRLITHAALGGRWSSRMWHDERGGIGGLWAGLGAAECASRKPAEHTTAWWAEFASNEQPSATPARSRSKTPTQSLLVWAHLYWQRCGIRPSAVGLRAQLVEAHRSLSPTARAVLRAIGRYPLITARDLANVLAVRADHITAAVRALIHYELIELIPNAGHALTGAGVALHAGWARFDPAEYATLLRWPVRVESRRLIYSTHAWRDQAEHTRLILCFLVGLRRFGPRHGLKLVVWDHVRCEESLRGRDAVVIPDAVGVVRIKGGESARLLARGGSRHAARRGAVGQAQSLLHAARPCAAGVDPRRARRRGALAIAAPPAARLGRAPSHAARRSIGAGRSA